MDKFNNMVGYFNKFHLLKPINLTPSIFFLYFKPKKGR